MDAVVPRLILGEGTAESRWQAWMQSHPVMHADAAALLRDSGIVHVVAPHPDDEILACAGLIRRWHALGAAIHIIAVTDGEASHPGSRQWSPSQLAAERSRESEQALAALNVPATRTRLALPDGQVAAREQELVQRLSQWLSPGGLVIAPWSLDGHPDHEAAGRASRHAASAKECRCLEAPIWGWHWAAPEDGSFPWPRAVAVRLGEDDLRAKHRAIAQFRSQLEPDPSTGNAPILPGFALARVLRPFEVLLR
ncbi:Uncharacterized proteins%2C LmbE homologs [Bordetella ansorpii]|jgi:LmbE family N-acetylglucosaminyl deacetylase|uniref:Uncharacterized proteins, LmbE homologs n=2 Tax=Bordetella ansorpii TaxID=288768 RepID=A0A157NLN6_9BORD|nr:Uncharacterized proteins%2C LmbE homologs [Bordetella ansorpii]